MNHENKYLYVSFLFLICLFQNDYLLSKSLDPIWFFPNKGQFEKNVQFHIDLTQGDFFIDNNGFTFNFFDSPNSHVNHKHRKERKIKESETYLKGQTVRYKFLNANLKQFKSIGDTSNHYKNFFYKNLYVSNCKGVNKVKYLNIYLGVDLLLESDCEGFKYSYFISPNTSIKEIKQEISGNNYSFVDKEGNLHHTHIFGEIIEKKPLAWNLNTKGEKEFVEINFKIENNIITYEFPKGYDKNKPLIIDPQLIFSSFTGSTSDNWGFTATNDNNGNLYSGGIIFGVGYPITTGAYDINYQGGEIYSIAKDGSEIKTPIPGFDISISKFSSDGSQLLYSTYLGGLGNETPHSLIVNKKNELILFGATSSTDFPTSTFAYDKTFNSGIEFKTMDFYFKGSDIFISKFNDDGTDLLSSTYVGGSGNDGLGYGNLIYNYGDNFRGEISLTENEEIIIASTSNSKDFPIKNSFQTTLKGISDAVIIKLSSNLDKLLFSSYIGGEGEETGNAIYYSNDTKKIYITGGTTSNSMNSNINVNKNVNHGGNADGYAAIIDNLNYTLEAIRYIGTASYDQTYFIQLDQDKNIFLLGQTEGRIGISPGKYGNPNSGLFIQKFNQDLTSFLWGTTIGGQSGNIEISPTAFMVSDCNDIFLTGWGSSVNEYEGHVLKSSTLNFPITEDAIQKTTEGDNFYIAILDNDGENLKFGSFFGGVGKFGSHVDGGTSRFDKKGGIYHAVCGACGGNPNGFTTTPGVWSAENKSKNCNLAAFKIELNKISAIAKVSDSITCTGLSVKFLNDSKSADIFEWDFGDYNFSKEKNPTHTFLKKGKYKIRLIASNSKKCIIQDTTFIDITVNELNEKRTKPTTYLCKDTLISLEMDIINNANYLWKSSPKKNLNETSNILKTEITPPKKIYGITKINCSTIEYEYIFEKLNNQLNINKDFSTCYGNPVSISVGKVNSIDWKNYPEFKNKTDITISPDKNLNLSFFAKTTDNCPIIDSIHIEVFKQNDKLISFKDTTLCFGDSITIKTKYLKNVIWSDLKYINQLKDYSYINPKYDKIYNLTYTDPCEAKTESFEIKLKRPQLIVSNDTTICLGDSTLIYASNMKSYEWQDYYFSKIESTSSLKVSPPSNTSYKVTGKDELGCIDSKMINVNIYPKTNFKVSVLQNADWENPAIIQITGNNLNAIKWNPKEFLSCDSCFTTNTYISDNKIYTIKITDNNTCTDTLQISLNFVPNLYIPNAFYPNSKNGNSKFKAIGTNIKDFEMTIYNRWGELIYVLNDIEDGWDGTYKNQKCSSDVYIWKVKYTTVREEFKEQTGHLTLIR